MRVCRSKLNTTINWALDNRVRANLKAKKYEGKERVESTAFDGDEKERVESTEFDGDDGEKGMA